MREKNHAKNQCSTVRMKMSVKAYCLVWTVLTIAVWAVLCVVGSRRAVVTEQADRPKLVALDEAMCDAALPVHAQYDLEHLCYLPAVEKRSYLRGLHNMRTMIICVICDGIAEALRSGASVTDAALRRYRQEARGRVVEASDVLCSDHVEAAVYDHARAWEQHALMYTSLGDADVEDAVRYVVCRAYCDELRVS